MGPGRRKRSREESRDAVPRLFRRRGWYGADNRRWGRGRLTLKDPDSTTWPEGGERTADREVATSWLLRYLEHFRAQDRRRQLKLGPAPRALGLAADEWLALRKRIVAYNTWLGNRTGITHLRDHLGDNFSTGRLTTPVLQSFFDQLHAEGYHPRSLRTYREAVAGFVAWLGQGKRQNAAIEVVLPRAVAEEVETWQPEDLDVLRDAADHLDRSGRGTFHSHRLALELALNAGARRNELFTLRWEQIRPKAKTIRITHQLDHQSASLAPLKGKLARTALLLPGWWEWHREGAKGLILPGEGGGLISPQKLIKIRVQLLEYAKLDVAGRGWHIDRHTYARDFIVEGGRYQELQRSLGHTSITTTERSYGHFGEDTAAELARRRIYREDPIRVVR